MEIKKITLRNFRNFRNSSIEFSCDPEKKFTVILGKNTEGKTTLVKAFIWCLYRENLFTDKILLNSDVADSLIPNRSEIVSVEVELTHGDFLYKITTKEKYTKTNSGSIIVSDKARTNIIKNDGINPSIVSPNQVEDTIESILRPELKEYFFFDGETNSIDSIRKKTNLTSAVINISGLDRVEILRDYYDPTKKESVPSYLRRELISGEDYSLEDIENERDRAYNNREQIEIEINNIKIQIKKLNDQLQDENEKLDINKDVEQDQNEKKRLEKDIVNAKNTKNESFKRMIDMINSSSALLKVLFADSYTKFKFNELQELSSFKPDASYKGISEEAVDDLIKAGKCLCGAPILNGSDAYKHLLEARQHMEPHDYGKYISDFVSTENANVYGSRSTLENIINEAGKVNNEIEVIEEDEARLKKIIERISGKPDVGEIQNTINNINRQIGAQEQRLNRLEFTELPNSKDIIDDINRRYSKASEKNEKNVFIQRCIKYAEKIYTLADNSLEKNKKEIRKELQKEVADVFQSMYHGNREIKIDENFKVEAVVSVAGNDKPLDKSQGLETVVNYSFVAGLLNLAKESIISNEVVAEKGLQNETYPLVMDAPFSNTDEEHIKNICDALPNYCDQIVILLMEKDFNYAKPAIESKIGKMYRLNKISETQSVVKEEDF